MTKKVSAPMCREKRQAAKRMGKRHAGSSEDDSDGAPSGDEGAGAEGEGADPFFVQEEDPFSDPFFQVASRAHSPCKACHLLGVSLYFQPDVGLDLPAVT